MAKDVSDDLVEVMAFGTVMNLEPSLLVYLEDAAGREDAEG